MSMSGSSSAASSRSMRQSVGRAVGGQVITVNEFYLLPDALDAEIRAAQLRAWAVVGVVGVITSGEVERVSSANSARYQRARRSRSRLRCFEPYKSLYPTLPGMRQGGTS